MSRNQKNSGVGPSPAPLSKPTDIGTSADASLGNLAPVGFDNLPTQQPAQCGQYGSGGTMPIVAPADAVPPAAGEVQL